MPGNHAISFIHSLNKYLDCILWQYLAQYDCLGQGYSRYLNRQYPSLWSLQSSVGTDFKQMYTVAFLKIILLNLKPFATIYIYISYVYTRSQISDLKTQLFSQLLQTLLLKSGALSNHIRVLPKVMHFILTHSLVTARLFTTKNTVSEGQ